MMPIFCDNYFKCLYWLLISVVIYYRSFRELLNRFINCIMTVLYVSHFFLYVLHITQEIMFDQ